uniref:Uncharacterized protein n=1 Tax=Mycena chlorophos TaxID=658473 RepID=A0ABQ0KXT3_MYCCL|nr:predicted protein [Mycena chlorophos]
MSFSPPSLCCCANRPFLQAHVLGALPPAPLSTLLPPAELSLTHPLFLDPDALSVPWRGSTRYPDSGVSFSLCICSRCDSSFVGSPAHCARNATVCTCNEHLRSTVSGTASFRLPVPHRHLPPTSARSEASWMPSQSHCAYHVDRPATSSTGAQLWANAKATTALLPLQLVAPLMLDEVSQPCLDRPDRRRRQPTTKTRPACTPLAGVPCALSLCSPDVVFAQACARCGQRWLPWENTGGRVAGVPHTSDAAPSQGVHLLRVAWSATVLGLVAACNNLPVSGIRLLPLSSAAMSFFFDSGLGTPSAYKMCQVLLLSAGAERRPA